MGKGKSEPVIWLLLYKKLTPKQIIALGYKKPTVYRYNSKYREVLDEFKSKLKEFKKKKK